MERVERMCEEALTELGGVSAWERIQTERKVSARVEPGPLLIGLFRWATLKQPSLGESWGRLIWKLSWEAFNPVGKGVPRSIGSKRRRGLYCDPGRRADCLQVMSDKRGKGVTKSWNVERAVDHARNVKRR